MSDETVFMVTPDTLSGLKADIGPGPGCVDDHQGDIWGVEVLDFGREVRIPTATGCIRFRSAVRRHKDG